MSYQAVRAVLERSHATGTDRLVLLVIAEHADTDGANAWPSRETIEREANVSTTAVKRALRSLRNAGELEVDERAGGSPNLRADRRPNRYRVMLAGLHEGPEADPRDIDEGPEPDPRQIDEGPEAAPRTHAYEGPLVNTRGAASGPRTTLNPPTPTPTAATDVASVDALDDEGPPATTRHEADGEAFADRWLRDLRGRRGDMTHAQRDTLDELAAARLDADLLPHERCRRLLEGVGLLEPPARRHGVTVGLLVDNLRGVVADDDALEPALDDLAREHTGVELLEALEDGWLEAVRARAGRPNTAAVVEHATAALADALVEVARVTVTTRSTT